MVSLYIGAPVYTRTTLRIRYIEADTDRLKRPAGKNNKTSVPDKDIGCRVRTEFLQSSFAEVSGKDSER